MNQKPISKRAFTERIPHPETGWGRPWSGHYGAPGTDERSQS